MLKKLVFLTVLLCNLTGQASTSDSLGLGVRNLGLGGASGVTDGKAYAAKGNPATLVHYSKIQGSISYFNSNYGLKDSGTISGQNKSKIANDNYKLSEAKGGSNLHFGATFLLSKNLGLGVAGILPAESFAKVHAFTGNESTYLHFNERQQNPEIYTAFGLQLPQNFSLGGGVLYTVKAEGILQMGVSDTDAEARMLVELRPSYVFYGGVLWKKYFDNSGLLLGLNYKDELAATTEINTDIRFDVGIGTIPFAASSQLVTFYDPAVWSLGSSYQTKKYNLYFGLDYSQWSKYQAPVINLSGKDLDVLNGGQVTQDPITLEDTYSFRMGLEWKKLASFKKNRLKALLGGEYHTSAVSKKPSSIAVLDSNRRVLSTGFEFVMPPLGDFIAYPLHIDIGAKWINLEKRTLTVSSSEGEKSAKVGGNVYAVGGGLSVEF